MLVEYWRTVIEEGHRVGYRDMAEMRAAVGLQDEPLGWPRWVRTARYFRATIARRAASFSAAAAGRRRIATFCGRARFEMTFGERQLSFGNLSYDTRCHEIR